jgi:hypothetical protein
MTDLEKRAITVLRSVKMPEQTWHVRRVDSLSSLMTLYPERKLDVGQKADLWFLVWRYRRQIDDGELVRTANEVVNGAFSLAF